MTNEIETPATPYGGQPLPGSVIDAIADCIVIFDGRGVILRVNAAIEAIFGYAAQEATGHNVETLIAEASRAEFDRFLATLPDVNTAVGPRRRLRGRRRHGDSFPIEVTASAFLLEGRRRYVALARDVTEANRVVRELRDDRKQLRAMTTEVSVAEERERRRIAALLHNQIGGALAAAKVKLAEHLEGRLNPERAPRWRTSAISLTRRSRRRDR